MITTIAPVHPDIMGTLVTFVQSVRTDYRSSIPTGREIIYAVGHLGIRAPTPARQVSFQPVHIFVALTDNSRVVDA